MPECPQKGEVFVNDGETMTMEKFDETCKKIKRELDAFPHPVGGGRRYGSGHGGTLNTITPCAACKLLRRRCAQECPFSPYFSPHEPQKFASVHKVFGASNVSKMLMDVPECQRADAANSLVYEANVRLRDPVYGCMGAISSLQQQIQFLQAELNAVRDEILKHRYRDHSLLPSSSQMALLSSEAISIVTPPPPLLLPLPPPRPRPPLLLLPSSSPLYNTAKSSAAHFSTIATENFTYFD